MGNIIINNNIIGNLLQKKMKDSWITPPWRRKCNLLSIPKLLLIGSIMLNSGNMTDAI